MRRPEGFRGVLQNALKLKAGDILIFGRTKQGELLLGGRARTASDKDRKAPPRTRKSEGAPGDKPAVKSAPHSLESLPPRCTCKKTGPAWCELADERSPQAADGVLGYLGAESS